MNVMRDAQIWDQNNVHLAYYKCASNICTNVRTYMCICCAYKYAHVVRTNVRTLYLCTVEFQRDDCMTMQMFVRAFT